MPQISYRANLSAAIFPLSLSAAGRTVIVPGPDNNYDRRVDPEGEQKDAGIPQAIYLENVIPTANGYQSVGLFTSTSVPVGEVFSVLVAYDQGQITFHRVPIIYDGTGLYATNNVVVSTFGPAIISGVARYPNTGVLPRQGRGITSAVIRDKSYALICDQSTSFYTCSFYETTYDGVDTTFTNVTASVTGIDFALAVEVCSSFNYLIVLNKDGSIQWSSTTTPLDFVPSAVTGAGSIRPNETRNIVYSIESCPEGFYLYTAAGLILGSYTGNSRYPWKFVSVKGTERAVSFTSDANNVGVTVYVDLANNIRVVEGNDSTLVAPEVVDYLRKELQYWTFNSTTYGFELNAKWPTTTPKIFYWLNRYLLVSCDPSSATNYSSVLWYDMQLRRYGKLRINHRYIVAMQNEVGNLQKLYFISDTGALYELSLTVYYSDADNIQNVIVLGKFQYVRGRRLELHEIIIENTQLPGIVAGDLSCKILTSNNGSIATGVVTPTVVSSSSITAFREYACRAEGHNLMLVITGAFDLTTLELTFSTGGAR